MHSKQLLRLTINGILFNVAWLACVLGGNQIAIIAALLMLAIHLAYISDVPQELFFIAAVSVFGFSLDNILFITNVLVNPEGAGLAPIWLLSLWLCFATTLNHCFRFLHYRLGLAAILGAISGTLSYFTGVRLSGVEFGVELPVVIVVLFVEWLIVFPLLIWGAQKFTARFFSEV